MQPPDLDTGLLDDLIALHVDAHRSNESITDESAAGSAVVDGGDDDVVVASEVATESSWRPVDLLDAVNGRDVAAPVILRRDDGPALLYAGRVHWIQGEPESLKSWLAQVAVAQVLGDGGRVLWVDFEDDERGVVSRLRALGVPADVLLSGRFVYVRPDEPLYARDRAQALPGWVALGELVGQAWALVVIDGVTEAMTVEGLSLIDNADVASWMRLLPKRFASAGAAVAVLDHVAKSRESQGRWALGGGHKLAGVTGATYRLAVLQPLGRSMSDPVSGRVLVTVEKDRPGWVRGRCQVGGAVAVLDLTAYPDGGVTARLVEPADGASAPPRLLVVAVLDHLRVYDGSAKGAVESGVGGKSETARAAIRWCERQGWVEVHREGVAHRHYLTDAGRAELDSEGRGSGRDER